MFINFWTITVYLHKKCLFWFQEQYIASEVTQPLGKKQIKNKLFCENVLHQWLHRLYPT